MKIRNQRLDGQQVPRRRGERGSVLVLALLVMIIMTLLGLTFMQVGEMESKIAVNQRNAEQALYVAEGGVRMVKDWFDAPSGSTSFLVPTTSQIDRSQRYVDDNADGTYGFYSSAASPFNVIYRQGTNDPFEKPYRGSPSLMFLGTEDYPDVRISETGSAGEQTYLAALNASLFRTVPGGGQHAFLAGGQQARVSQIDVFAPPIILTGGVRVRYGIATIKVTAGIFEHAGTAAERRIATRVAKAVLNELPIPGPLGPLQSKTNVDFNGNFSVHWGKVTSTNDMVLPSTLNQKIPSSIPWYSYSRIIARDMDLNGIPETSKTVATNDDLNHDGTLDFDTWIDSDDVEDPWLRFLAEGTLNGVSPGCSGPDCQPKPWYSGGVFGTGSDDHSNLFHHVSTPTFPDFDYALWKNIAQSGGANVFYYASDGPGTGTYKLNGSGPSVSFRTATEGKRGLFFFDTATNSAPFDSGSDGTFDNLADEIQINGRSYFTAGIIFLNADFSTTGGGSPPTMTVFAPGEPFIDANGNGQYDPEEYFVDLTYPSASRVNDPFVKNGMHREFGTSYRRKVPANDSSVGGRYDIGVNIYGVLYTNGNYDATGNFTHYGCVLTRGGMGSSPSAGTPDIYFDERLVSGNWPPADIHLPRTVISAWETEN